MAVYQMELVDRERIARDTMAFWLSTDGCQYEFRAGQIIMKGKSGVIKHLADHMIAMRGVKHGKLVLTSTGKYLR